LVQFIGVTGHGTQIAATICGAWSWSADGFARLAIGGVDSRPAPSRSMGFKEAGVIS